MKQTQQLIRGMQKGLLNWYNFESGSRVLYIGDKEDALAEVLSGHSLSCQTNCEMFSEERMLDTVFATIEQTCDPLWRQEYVEKFDYLISIEDLELEIEPERILKIWRN